MTSLSTLLNSFSAPVTEEHAWALIHQVRILWKYKYKCKY